MPGKGKPKAVKSGSKRHYKVKQQKKRFIRSKDPILSVFMWGIQHSVSHTNLFMITFTMYRLSIVCQIMYYIATYRNVCNLSPTLAASILFSL